jgi:hypothetical protein
MTVTQSNGLMVPADCFGGTLLGSSLHLDKARFILSLPLYQNDLLKIFIFFYRAFFTSKKYVRIPL